ncbi:SDR family NAD(P)-dependent oxidoreductase [Bradyrhizobium canariense]|uniref:NADP-dependent 3-hydroxy acid dehydrogenase YdfG n=1 Tax=Bradyrhizobium canariense TaxID=255045 RepID=A0A1H1WGP4_9BRAD|nr:SDR family NAD(P)-dependent oxidoreductase [Bradyrhizobium canariense]SDS96245.1 NADP-dependent 3-hydroxy acid dehydrogenase YdfG [Bradyrhizobium canariense]
MMDFSGKTAFVTGGASGIGFALCRAFGQRGMSVAIADVEAEACAKAVETLRNEGIRAIGTSCDVSDRNSLAGAANRTFSELGKVHVLCNNAGVSRAGPIESIAASDWEWVIGVNLKGLIHGLQIFLPHIKAHGETGHIVNTASMNGVVGAPLAGPYSATKFASVGISEVLAAELEDSLIGVSVLCPSWVKTRMLDNGRNRPAHFGGPISLDADGANAERNKRYAKALENGLDPADVAKLVIEAIETRRLYIFTHADRRSDVERRFELMMEGFEALAEKPAEPPQRQAESKRR